MKFLIIKLSALGDIVQTLPALTLLKKYLPSSKIDWVIDKRYAEILENHPYINKLFVISKEDYKSLRKFFRFIRTLRKTYYDAVIDYQGLLKSGIIVGLSKGKYKIGFKNHREFSPFFYNIKLPPYDPEIHAVKRYINLSKEILRLFDLKINENFNEVLEALFPKEIFDLNPFFKEPYIIFIPTARWKTKTWFFSYWEKLIYLCEDVRKNFHILITGSKNEKELKIWAKEMESKYKKVYSLVGKLNLKELVAVINKARLVVCVDTGPMHIASALKKPIIALFGPTSPNRTGPWNTRYQILSADIKCRPCFKKNCKTLECLKKITPELVKDAIEKELSLVKS
ncbi:lipopolysaccharide heptosyltransferase I [Candidatus Pacearchaeota archaeon]|nr:MAG: lipopolysaccharide heptosyltransferase I [Candidatus Pacearchaeota archaeon]